MADHHPIQHGGGPLWSLDGVFPQLHPDAWVAPTAVIIGDVEIAMGASIWFNCVLRGDTNRIRVGARSNVQDAAVLHVNPGEGMECNVGDDVTIGHGAIVHAAHLHDGAFVGMAAVVLDRAVIETAGGRRGTDAGQAYRPQRIMGRHARQAGACAVGRGKGPLRPERPSLRAERDTLPPRPLYRNRITPPAGQVPYRATSPALKVFRFFSSEKNNLYLMVLRPLAGERSKRRRRCGRPGRRLAERRHGGAARADPRRT